MVTPDDVDALGSGATVERITLHRVSVPLASSMLAAHGVEDRRESTIVCAELADGTRGWGECVALARPTYTSEYADGAFRVLADLVAPALLGRRPVRIVGHPMASAAIEGAVIDAVLRTEGRSLAAALGAVRRAVPTAAVVGRRDSIDRLVAAVADVVAAGVGAVSLKIQPGWDVEPLAAVRSTWPGVELAADANGSYADAADDLATLDALGLHHLEQPLPADALVATAELRATMATPIALDESITSPSTVDLAVRVGAVDAVNLKPARVGGLAAALRVIERARAHALDVYCGGMLETAVGRAHAVAVAALEGVVWPTHLGPSARYLAADLAEPFVLDDHGRLPVPDDVGIGRTPDPARLESVEIARASVER